MAAHLIKVIITRMMTLMVKADTLNNNDGAELHYLVKVVGI
jgi:hypothetical protein